MPPLSVSMARSFGSGFPRLAGVFACALGVIVLVGWTFHISLLISIVPGYVPMNPATAIGFILLGASLLLLNDESISRGRRIVGQACGGAALLIGLLKLIDHFSRLNVGIDRLLFSDRLMHVAYAPNRMAPNTAANFALFGFALVLLDVQTRRGLRLAQYIALAAGVVSLVALSAYAFQSFAFSSGATSIPMALHTAVTFTVLTAGVLLARPERGIMRVITQPGPVGRISRRLLLAAIGAPMALGWLRLWGQRKGLYGTEYGTTLFAVAIIIILSAVVWFNARWLDRAESKRSRAEEERESFFIFSLDLLCIAGTDGIFTRVNPSWERVLGYTEAELTSRPYTDFVHPDDIQATQTETLKIVGGENTFTFENRYRSKNGSYHWMMWNAGYSADRGLIYAVARDITERKVTESAIRDLNQLLEDQNAQLESANKELESFSYSVSHDLRAPLRAIDGFSQALIEDNAGQLDPDGLNKLHRVRTATQRMGQLIDDMLGLASVTRGEMRREHVDLSAIAKTVVDELRRAEPDRKVDIQIAPDLIARGDARLLRIVLDNLLGNAWKFTARQEAARIELGREADGAFFVRDNGAGFDMTFAKKLFGAFQRLHSVKEFAGTGVGLATVQRIIHRHRGHVSAEAAIGQGATFRFTIPPADADRRQTA